MLVMQNQIAYAQRTPRNLLGMRSSLTGTLYEVSSADDYLYSDVVLVVVLTENEWGDLEIAATGSGFMASSRVMVSAAHVILYDSVNHPEIRVYYFNCYAVNETIAGEEVFSVGYPSLYAYKIMESAGQVENFWPNPAITVNARMIEGMSGGPIYAYVGGRSAIAINKAHQTSNPNIGIGTIFTTSIIDVICDTILAT